jgi:ubiquitin-like protein Nedd8
MQIFVERMVGPNFQLQVEEDESIEDLKMKIYRILSIVPDQQRLVYQGEHMLEDKTISDYNIQEGSVIHLSIWSTGSAAWREI